VNRQVNWESMPSVKRHGFHKQATLVNRPVMMANRQESNWQQPVVNMLANWESTRLPLNTQVNWENTQLPMNMQEMMESMQEKSVNKLAMWEKRQEKLVKRLVMWEKRQEKLVKRLVMWEKRQSEKIDTMIRAVNMHTTVNCYHRRRLVRMPVHPAVDWTVQLKREILQHEWAFACHHMSCQYQPHLPTAVHVHPSVRPRRQ